MNTFPLIWLVLFLPLAGFLVQSLVGGRIVKSRGDKSGKKLMGALAVAPVAIAFLLGVIITFDLATIAPAERASTQTLFNWITLQSISIPFEVRIDPLSMTMVLIITGIGALIHLYATGYMSEERDYTRFFTYLNLFIAMMLILVLGNNLVLMFLGWEGVGLCSYLLIGFWYKDLANARAANKAFIVNRIGDWGFMLGIFLLVTMMVLNADRLAVAAGDNRLLSFDFLLGNMVAVLGDNPGVATAIALLLFVGAAGKSAQFPLYFWLPDAMAGPTPVSALIHAATMVTAGVFMLNRMHPVFEMSPFAGVVIGCIGAFTALIAALIAFGQTDIKKVLAFSTVSQLGFMFIACGVGAYWVGMFHVTTHAFFKALLFLGSGAVIHAMAHEQDMRKYGGLKKYLPITSWTMIIGWLAIAGMIPFAGFWSKEAILGNAFANSYAVVGGVNVGYWLGWVALFVALLTAGYMTRMTWMTFYGGEERWRLIPEHAPAQHHHDDAQVHEVDMHETHFEAHEDLHGFFYTEDELSEASQMDRAHHHELDETHEPHEVPPSMSIPLIVLAALSVVGGLAMYFGGFQQWLYPAGLAVLTPEVVEGHPHDWLGAGIVGPINVLVVISVVVATLGILYGVLVYRRGLPKREGDEATWHPFRRAASSQFGYDSFLSETAVQGGDDFAKGVWRFFDVGVIDGAVNGLAKIAGAFGVIFRRTQTGYIRLYALVMLVGAVVFVGYFAYLSNIAPPDAPPETGRVAPPGLEPTPIGAVRGGM
jgi:NADH-quinone oxidoreductase subunit L